MVQLRKITVSRLRGLKQYRRQTYDEVINRILDNPDDLSMDDISEIKAGMADIRAGRFATRAEVANKLGIRQ